MRVENPMFLHVMSLSMIQLSAAVISQSQKRAAMHQQNPPECHQRTGGRCTHSSEYPTSSPKGILFAFPLLKIIMKLIKKINHHHSECVSPACWVAQLDKRQMLPIPAVCSFISFFFGVFLLSFYYRADLTANDTEILRVELSGTVTI